MTSHAATTVGRIGAPLPAVRARSTDRLAPPIFWVLAAVILAGGLYFHSKIDPGGRFEFRTTGQASYGPSWFEDQKFGPLTPADVLTFAFAYLSLIYRFTRPGRRVSPTAIKVAALIAVPVVLGTAVGIANGTHNPLGDTRDFICGAMFAVGLWSSLLTSQEGCFRFAQLFVGMVAIYGIDQLFQFAAGGGELTFYARVPTGDHATLEFMVAAVGISLAMLRTRRTPALWWIAIAVGTMVVALAFRRYAWIELAVVFGVFLVLSGKYRAKYLAGIMGVLAALAIAVTVLGASNNWIERLTSINPTATKTTNAYAATNQGHIDDILDGFDQIRAHPLTGLGVGITYVGQRTARWKGDAGMVHNGPVELWIKFTVIGVITYFVVYFILFRAIWRRRHGTSYSDLLAWGAGSFLFGQFIITTTVYAWPFAVWEKSVLVFAVLACMFPRIIERSPETDD